MQNRAMRNYAARRAWTIVMQVKEVGSGASQRVAAATGEKLIDAARRREIDAVLVWRLDRCGRSVTRSANYTAPTSANPKSHAGSASAAPLCAVSLPLRPEN
jgi:DNA invertase Pin-like site-specific DNA recombinase